MKRISILILIILSLSVGVFALAACTKDESPVEVESIAIKWADAKNEFVTEGDLFAVDKFIIVATLTDKTEKTIATTNAALHFDKSALLLSGDNKYTYESGKEYTLKVFYLTYTSAELKIIVKRA